MINILFNNYHIFEILPKKNYDLNRKLNSIVRFSIYFAIILFIFNKDKNILCLPFIVMVFTIILYKYNSKNRRFYNY